LPTPYVPPGVDLSHWNGSVDFQALGAAQIKFAYSKATQGFTFHDWAYYDHVVQGAAAGMLMGAYHFFDYTRDGLIQADNFVDFVSANGGFNAMLPPVVDVECLVSMGASDQPYAAQQLHAFSGEVFRRTGRLPIIYTSRYMWALVTGSDATFGKQPLWVACWRCSRPSLPVGWSSYRFWQTGAVRVPGIAGTLDGDIFNGTDAGLANQRTIPHLLDSDATYATSTAVEMNLTGSDGTSARYSLDGTNWSEWRPWTPTARFELAPTNGPQIVFVQFRDQWGNQSPVTGDSIILDDSPPTMTAPSAGFRLGAMSSAIGGPGIPIIATWSSADATSGLQSTELLLTCGTAAADAASVPLSSAIATSADLLLAAGNRCQLTGRATDYAGLVVEPAPLPGFTVGVIQQKPSTTLTYRGRWSRASGSGFDGGAVRSARSAASATLRFTGISVALVSTLGPDRGKVRLVVDGVWVTTVDLYSLARVYRQIVFSMPLAPGPHTLTVKVVGTRNPASTGTRADIDAFLVLRP